MPCKEFYERHSKDDWRKEMLDKNMRKYSLSNDNIKYYNENCYYYATGDLYGKLNDFHTPDNETYSYLEHLREVKKREDTWYTFYAMDWLCQIDFFMKFVNQRILYITGSTGQGKSTQVPKLTLYGLKAFYYKDSGKAICTQPRINATVENVVFETIRSEMMETKRLKKRRRPNRPHLKAYVDNDDSESSDE